MMQARKKLDSKVRNERNINIISSFPFIICSIFYFTRPHHYRFFINSFFINSFFISFGVFFFRTRVIT